MKSKMILVFLSTIGSFIAGLFGGWTMALTTLLIFVIIDYVTGLIVAGIFHKSTKTENGALKSDVGFKGLIKKFFIFVIIFLGYRLDLMLNLGVSIKDIAAIFFCSNELISIIENMGLMGIPMPPVIINAVDILKSKGNETVNPKEVTTEEKKE